MKTFKIVLVGDDKVGKSTFVQKLYNHTFKETYSPTLGVNVVPIRIQTSAGNVCFNIWDCAGNESYEGLGSLYYSAADAAIMMFDLSDPRTYRSRFNEPHKITKITGTIPMVYVGNKYDAVGTSYEDARYWFCTDSCVAVRRTQESIIGLSRFGSRDSQTDSGLVFEPLKPTRIKN